MRIAGDHGPDGDPANPLDDPADAEALDGYARALADAVVAALPGWVTRVVAERCHVGGQEPPVAEVAAAGRDVQRKVEPPLRALLATDVDEQRSNPLAIVRQAVPTLTAVLREAGVPPVARDSHAVQLFPDDVYDLAPASFADLHPSVQEPGIRWGAAKAHVVLRRRRAADR